MDSSLHLTSATAKLLVLPPPDLSSSSHKRINLLVCTANLGNAPPDADSWNAWIPKDGKLVTKTQFPVRMNPPPPPPPVPVTVPQQPPHRSHSGELNSRKSRKPSRRSSNQGPSDNHNNVGRKQRKSNTNDYDTTIATVASTDEKDGYEAYLESIKGGSYSLDSDVDGGGGSRKDDASSKASRKQQQPDDRDRKRAPSQRSRSNQQQESDEPSPSLGSAKSRAQKETPKRGKPLKGKGEPRRGARRSRSNNLPQQDGVSPTTPKPQRARSKSIDLSTPEQQPRRVLRSKSIGTSMIGQQPLKSPSTPKTTTKTPDQLRRVLRSKSIDTSMIGEQSFKSPKTPTKSPDQLRRVLRSKSIDAGPLLASTPEQRRRVLRSKNSTSAATESSSASPRPRKFVRNNKDAAAIAEETPKPRRNVTRKSSARSKSPLRGVLSRTRSKSPKRAVANRSRSKSSTRMTWTRNNSNDDSDIKKDPSDVPVSRKIVNAEIPQVEIDQIKEFEIRYPNRMGVAADPDNNNNNNHNISNQLGCYDIIVIGMQEATFDLNKKQKEDESSKQQQQEQPKQKTSQIEPPQSNSDDDTGSDDGSHTGEITDDGSLVSLADDGDDINVAKSADDDEAEPKEGKKNQKKQMSRKKLKSGLLKKITKKASKTAKTVNDLAGGGKDHTARMLQAKPSEDEEDTKIVVGLEPSKSFASLGSGDSEDKDFSAADGDDGVPLANGSNGKTSAKKWTDTDVLHNGIESNQLPGYTRALSYQVCTISLFLLRITAMPSLERVACSFSPSHSFPLICYLLHVLCLMQFGQMRLMVYYKAGTAADDVVQTLDVLSVNYQATGKAGFANKGGIVAEVAVNKTTKLSFLTTHLEAHEGAKHYKARNDSLSTILMDTSSSKHFDASQSSHFTFAMGDLNYRTKLADVAVGSDRHIQFCHTIVGRRDWRTINQFDELRKSLAKKTCLAGFQTAYCNFPPTFKVDRQHGYRYNPARSPSYTDRILFKTADQLDSGTKLLLYEPVEAFTSSDHKPIRSGFTIRLNRELRWKSTAELLVAQTEFNNDNKNKSLDDRTGIVLPDTTTGDIQSDRETMNIFVTNIECVINPSNYDSLRRQEKAELPNPKVLFITSPSEAVLPLEDLAKKRRFGRSKSLPFDNPKKNSSSSTKFPSTPVSKDTMRPIWKDGHVYLALQTHTEHGRPIDLTGSQLHISLVDAKNSNSRIGSHCLNLAHLIIRSREKADKTLDRTASYHGMESPKSQQQGNKPRFGSKRPGSSKRLNEKPESSKKLNEKPTSSRRLSGSSSHGSSSHAEKVGKPLKPLKPSSLSAAASPGSGSYQLVPKPSPAMRSAAAAAKALKIGGDGSNNYSNLPQAVKNAAESIHRIENGSSKLYESIMADLNLGEGIGSSSSSSTKNLQSIEELGLKSLRLQETLTEGGLVIGQIKCDIDIWWT